MMSRPLQQRASALKTIVARSLWVIGLPVALGAGVAGADWPTYRHDYARSGWTSERLALPLEASWVYTPPAEPQTAWSGAEGRLIEGHILNPRIKFDDSLHVVVAGDRTYFGSSVDHQVHCLRSTTGEELWTFCTGGPIRLAPTVSGGKLYFGSDDGRAYCIDAATGRLIWSVRPSLREEWILARGQMISRWPVRTGVLVDAGVAYFGAGIFPHDDVYICAVSADGGKVLWQHNDISDNEAGRSDLSPQGYLLAAGQRLFVPSGGTLPAAVDRLTGEVLYKRTHAWRTTAGGAVGGTEALLADDQLYSFGTEHILAMDQPKGNVGFGWFAGRLMAVHNAEAYTANGKMISRLDRLAYAKGSTKRHEVELQVSELQKKINKKPDVSEKQKQEVADLRAKIKQLAAIGVTWQVANKDCSALAGAGETLLVGGDGVVTAYDTADGKALWTASVEGNARGLAVAGGQLWVSTSKGKIYCFAPPSAKVAVGIAPHPPASPFPRDNQTAKYEAAAEQILKQSGVTQGYCLVLGSRKGRLAYELAKRSKLTVYGIEPDQRLVDESRKALGSAGLYGSRVIIHQADYAAVPYSNYFANLIVSEALLDGDSLPAAPAAMARHLKPCGGVVCLGSAEGLPDQALKWLAGMQLADQSTTRTAGSWAILTRGALPGAGSWTHEHANPGNSACSDDELVRGGLSVLWYGDPGPGKVVNRHESAVAPLAVGGRFFLEGETTVMAYDSYNGALLWERDLPKANRTNAKAGRNTGNMAASEDQLFAVADNACLAFDAATGRLNANYHLPASIHAESHAWEYLAYSDGQVIGTATMRSTWRDTFTKFDTVKKNPKDVIFAIDVKTGKQLWEVTGHSIAPATIALGEGRVFFIDSSITSHQREALLRQDKTALRKLSDEEAKQAEARMKKLDLRVAIALDAKTGQQVWAQPVDVTDCSHVGTGGGELTQMYTNGTLIVCGANANGHFWQQFLAGEFSSRRLVALSASDGYQLWARDANYRHRPLIVGSHVIAEPWSYELTTGRQETRPHPTTQQPTAWSVMRPGHHCGAIAGSPNMLTFRSGSLGFYDLTADDGTQHFAGQRPGCWINAIPANGLVIMPEASAGCVCLFSIAATVVLEPCAPRHPWTIASATGPTTPVEHLALNFGAPGDRRDSQGTFWLACPRPAPHKDTGLDLKLDLKTAFLKGGEYTHADLESTEVHGTATPWLFTCWANGLSTCSIPLRGKGDGPATYDLKLYLAELRDVKPGQRIFDVKVQGQTAIKGLDVYQAAKNRDTALVREVKDVKVTDDLLIEFVPHTAEPKPDQMPILNALEITKRN